jgi:hypothetical protein
MHSSKTYPNDFHVLIRDFTAPTLGVTLGITQQRGNSLCDDICEALAIDTALATKNIPGRAKHGLARVIQLATKNCENVNETAWVVYMILKGLQTVQSEKDVEVIEGLAKIFSPKTTTTKP